MVRMESSICSLLMRRVSRLAVPAGVVLFSWVNNTAAEDVAPPAPRDSRIAKLEAFFRSHDCPAPYHVDEYLQAADAYSIDYRLLPALSIRESTCGKYQRMNNYWGWDSARSGFASVETGIDFVAHRLAKGRYYKGKALEDKLHAYNPYPDYANEVLSLMREIGQPYDVESGAGD